MSATLDGKNQCLLRHGLRFLNQNNKRTLHSQFEPGGLNGQLDLLSGTM